ncbi:MAG: hypothetical protein EOL95_07255 [Bacteroidia bacterium]|nr:hypothetical protein [Bacteroidia bacterium]
MMGISKTFIKSALPDVERAASEYLDNITLLDGERYVAAVLNKTSEGLTISLVAFDENDTAVRQINSERADLFIIKIIENTL